MDACFWINAPQGCGNNETKSVLGVGGTENTVERCEHVVKCMYENQLCTQISLNSGWAYLHLSRGTETEMDVQVSRFSRRTFSGSAPSRRLCREFCLPWQRRGRWRSPGCKNGWLHGTRSCGTQLSSNTGPCTADRCSGILALCCCLWCCRPGTPQSCFEGP